MKLRVMSYNIRWGLGTDGRYSLERVAEVIREAGADLVGLQEIERGSPRSRFRDQPALLGRMLEMEVAFGANLRLGGWRFGNALLSRFPLRRFRNVPLPVPTAHSPLFAARSREKSPWHASRPGERPASRRRPPLLSATRFLRRWSPALFDRRGVLVVEVGLVSLDAPALTALVTHLPLRREVRLAQAGAIVSLLPGVGDATIVMGDLNEGPQGEVMQCLQEGGLANLSGGEPTFPSTRPTGKIDFILGRGRLRGLDPPRVIASPASDHLPVVVDLEIWTKVETQRGLHTS
jgi:endonuclease/exonuclease/phosphatase family metal-dependent hydrolase